MSDEEFNGLGFAPGTVKGVRSFTVDKYGRLRGIHYPQVWTPGENLAVCRKDEGMDSMWRLVQNYTNTINVQAPSRRSGWFGGATTASTSTERSKPLQHSFEFCRCGFYGYFDGSDDYHDAARITAVIEAYGEAIIGTRGFRAKKARIVALRIKSGADGITDSVARKVSTNYAGVAIFDDFAAMVAAFPPDQSLEPSPESDPDFWTRA